VFLSASSGLLNLVYLLAEVLDKKEMCLLWANSGGNPVHQRCRRGRTMSGMNIPECTSLDVVMIGSNIPPLLCCTPCPEFRAEYSPYRSIRVCSKRGI
jgi:hypothetical protein